MNISFAHPLAFFGFLALGILLMIYFFKAKFQEKTISSLIFWVEEMNPSEGGRKKKPPTLPLIFFLETLIIALTVLAATGPWIPIQKNARFYSLILDDSFSMLAGGQKNHRQDAINFLKNELNNLSCSGIQVILAGNQPEIIANNLKSFQQIEKLLETDWNCFSSQSLISESIALALEFGGNRSRILVITDHPPDETPKDGRIRWISVGENIPNLAFTQALRSSTGENEKVLFEITNFASETKQTELKINIDGEEKKSSITVSPDQKLIFKYDLEPGKGLFSASISEDSLDFDNRISLVEVRKKPLPVILQISNPVLYDSLKKAIESTESAVILSDHPLMNSPTNPASIPSDNREKSGLALSGSFNPSPLLAFLDQKASEQNYLSNCWKVKFIQPENSKAFMGPFLLDKSHPICEGLSMNDCIWGAQEKLSLPGEPLIFLGDTPLMTINATNIFFQIYPEKSNLFLSPDWPILISNILDFRNESTPGPERKNLFLGSHLKLFFPGGKFDGVLLTPDKSSLSIKKSKNIVIASEANAKWQNKEEKVEITNSEILDNHEKLIFPKFPGIYNFQVENEEWNFAVNPCSPEESDLRKCSPGAWGNWTDDSSDRQKFSLSGILILLALILSMLHGWYVSKLSLGSGEFA
ncbi:MAG: BatA and WFA domain-containing protein [Candidatus Riflebacteria bacterium]|nr:BatA and WFA domain-containing protein [Candidatus Riflebacteria bacterium]